MNSVCYQDWCTCRHQQTLSEGILVKAYRLHLWKYSTKSILVKVSAKNHLKLVEQSLFIFCCQHCYVLKIIQNTTSTAHQDRMDLEGPSKMATLVKATCSFPHHVHCVSPPLQPQAARACLLATFFFFFTKQVRGCFLH